MLAKLINLGGFLNGSKTYLGLITLAVCAVDIFLPAYSEIVHQLLVYAGITLLPIGVADKIRKSV